MPDPPRTTVWVLAFHPRPSLTAALASVAADRSATRPPDVRVLSSDRPPEAPLPPSVRWEQLPRVPLGRWIGPMLDRTEAGLVAFLDDDDAFLPGKLGRAEAAFDEHPRLGYFHHARQEDGRGSGPPPRPAPDLVDDAHKDPPAVRRLWAAEGAFNHSSVVVRRELLDGLRTDLVEIEGGITPTLFFGCLASEYDLLEDPTPMTRYGRHTGSESPAGAVGFLDRWGRSLRIAPARRADADRVLAMVQRRRPALSAEPLRHARARYRVLEATGHRPVAPAELARAWRELLRSEPRPPLTFLVPAAAAGAIATLAPGSLGRTGRGAGPVPPA